MTTTDGRHHGGVLHATHFMPFDLLETRARRVAGGLATQGVAPGDCVALLMRNDTAFLEITYGVMRLGAYAVPINWHFAPDEVAFILRDCGAKALFAHGELLGAVGADLPSGLPLYAVTPPVGMASPALTSAIGYDGWLVQQNEHPGPARPAPMSMIYTSGTTGRPKGVRRVAPTPEVAAALDDLRARVYGLKPGIRALLPGPLYHSAPNSFGLRAGKIADLFVMMERFDPEDLLRLIEAERIDTMFVVPTMFIRLLKLPEEVRARYDVSSLRHVIHAAAPCPADVKAAMIAWWGPVIWEFYGGTESGPVSFCSSEDALKKPGSVGRATPGAELRILDDEDRPLPNGQIGEIYSSLPSYPDFTYHNDPEKRRGVERDGFITCGDVGYVDEDGYLFICDRKRDMVISGGVNIYPAEIEAVLHAMPEVNDCAVFGIPDAEYGEQVMAMIEPRAGHILDPEAIRAHLGTLLARYKVPRTIEIRDALPREDSGKIFKRRLRDPYWVEAGRRI